MSALISRIGIRAQLLVAPAVVLVLTAILGITSYRQLDASADMAKLSAAETTAVEILRDSNSRQFEGDRFQNLALRSPTQKEFDDNRAEAADVMKESADGFTQFARGARTPALRARRGEAGGADAAHPERARARVRHGACRHAALPRRREDHRRRRSVDRAGRRVQRRAGHRRAEGHRSHRQGRDARPQRAGSGWSSSCWRSRCCWPRS